MTLYLKKMQIVRALNLSADSFEQKLAAGLFPAPSIWLSENIKSRRWDASVVAKFLGVPVETFSSLPSELRRYPSPGKPS